jgi:phosphate-selective porin OprO/OprP
MGVGSGGSFLFADDSDLIKKLQQRIDDLEQKVKILERNRELDIETTETRAREAPSISIGERGFGFRSADGNFALRLRGAIQLDSRTFFHDHNIAGNDAFLLRRARPIIEGTVFRDFDFLFITDFGGATPQIFDASLNYRYNPALQLRLGKFKPPVGLEQLQADQDTFFNERGLPTGLVPNRNVGVQFWGEAAGGVVTYAAGVFNGIGDARISGNTSVDDDKEFAGRLFFHPFRNSHVTALQGLGVGAAGSFGEGHSPASLPLAPAGGLPGYTTEAQQQFFAYNPTGGAVVTADGRHWRLSPQGYYFFGPYSLIGEYVISNQRVTRTGAAPLTSARIENKAWQVSLSYVLTGEEVTYAGVVPSNPFDPSTGGWGAFQILGRVSALSVDLDAFPLYSDPTTSAHSAFAWTVGLNWWLNRNIRVMTSFTQTSFNGGGGTGVAAPASVTRQNENVLFTRVQLAF